MLEGSRMEEYECAVVPNIVLWDSLIAELDRQCWIVPWVKVPSHVGMEGNVEVDRLANFGTVAW